MSISSAPPARIGIALVVFAVVVVALPYLALLARPDGVLQLERLTDADGYLRLMRVQALRDGGAWFDDLMLRVAAPEGLVVQWTRPLDLLVLLPALAVESLLGLAPTRALFVVGLFVSPVLLVAAAVAAAWAAQAVWQGSAPWFAALLLGTMPAAQAYSSVGRADHHALILLAIVVALGATLRAFLPGARAAMAAAAGAAYGFGLWVGPEVVLVVVPVLAAAGLVAAIAPDGRAAARQGLAVALGMAAMLVVAIVVEHAPAQWAMVAYDQVSVHHLVLALLMAAVFAVAWRVGAAPRGRRVMLSAGAGLVAFALLVALYPDMLRGPLASADAQALASFVPFVEEIRPLPPLSAGSVVEPIMLFGGAVPLALVGILLAARGWMRDGRWPAGMVLAGALLATLVAAFLARRFALDLAAPAAIAGAGVVGLLVHGAWPRSEVARGLLAAAVFFGALALPYVGLALPQPPRQAAREGACDWTAMARWLDAARPAISPADPAPILMTADLFHGSEVAWRTPYRAVALPHHRAGAAIADTVAVLEAPEAEALGVLRRRGVRLLLACPGDPWPAARGGGLSEAIRAGRPVAGLAPVPLPADIGGFRLFVVGAAP
jgi:asparagine N-glycosylation enzyme membrane subunit Stt3